MNAVIYARYSSDKQTEQSIEGQLRYCNQYAEMHGYKIIGNYIDRAISGTSDNRPQFQQMIEDSHKKQFQFIIVWKLDRFARNRYDSAIYKNKLKKNGVKVLSATEGIGEGDESIILEAVLEAMAETYSRQLSQNVKRGLKESALKGNSTGGSIPLGYKLENGRLAVDVQTSPIVKRIFKEYAEGKSKSDIARDLNAQGYKTSTGSQFSVNSFSRILNNQKYIGIYHYNDIVIEDGCPAIIDFEVFNKCQDRAKANKRNSGHNKAKIEYELNGKLFCGYCGTSMVGDSAKGKYYYYACGGRKIKKSNCEKKREKKDFIEWYVVEQTVNYVLTPERIEIISQRIADAFNSDFSAEKIKDVTQDIKRLTSEFDRLTDALINATSKAMIDRINNRAEQIEIELSDKEQELASLNAVHKELKPSEVRKWLESICKGNLLDAEFRKRIIDTFINAVYLFDDKVVLYYNIKDGKQISYIEMIEHLNNIESSNINCCSSPKKQIPCVSVFCF